MTSKGTYLQYQGRTRQITSLKLTGQSNDVRPALVVIEEEKRSLSATVGQKILRFHPRICRHTSYMTRLFLRNGKGRQPWRSRAGFLEMRKEKLVKTPPGINVYQKSCQRARGSFSLTHEEAQTGRSTTMENLPAPLQREGETLQQPQHSNQVKE
jgi:hypothetical protein